jgi:hypothetical protein
MEHCEIVKKIKEDLATAEALMNVCGYLLGDYRINFEKKELGEIKEKVRMLKIAMKRLEKNIKVAEEVEHEGA